MNSRGGRSERVNIAGENEKSNAVTSGLYYGDAELKEEHACLAGAPEDALLECFLGGHLASKVLRHQPPDRLHGECM